MLSKDEMEAALFARWGNRCPCDGAFLFLEHDGPGFIPMMRCGLRHHMTLEHYVAAICQIPITGAIAKLQELFAALGDEFVEHPVPHFGLTAEALTPLQPFEFQAGKSDYWDKRGFPAEDQVKYGMGLVNGLPGITYVDEQGTTFGWIQRNPDVPENTKVVKLGGKYIYVDKNSKRRLWGVPYAKELMTAKGLGWVVVTEGCADAARFLQCRIPAVALNQPSFTKSHLLELLKLTPNLIVCPDDDEAGHHILSNGMAAAFLPVFFNVDCWVPKTKKDPAAYSTKKLLAEFRANFPHTGV